MQDSTSSQNQQQTMPLNLRLKQTMQKKVSLERFLKASEYAVDRSFANNSFLHLPRKTHQKYPNPVRRSYSRYDHFFQKQPQAILPQTTLDERKATTKVDQETQARLQGQTPKNFEAGMKTPPTAQEVDIKTIKLQRESTLQTEARSQDTRPGRRERAEVTASHKHNALPATF